MLEFREKTLKPLKVPNPQIKMKITRQYPIELKERRDLAEITQREKEKSPSVDTKIVGDSLFVNGKRYYDRIPKPSPRDIFM